MADAHDPDRASHESDASSSIALHLTETEQWDQEPFEQFRHKAEALCAQLWPVAGLLNIERIAGGGGNRIVAVDVAPVERKSKNTMKSIAGMKRIFEKLRILRRRQASPESSKRQAELPYAFRYAAQNFTFRTPDIIKVELNASNPIESPYVIQTRINGGPLDDLWETLNHRQRLSAATLVGKVLKEMTTVSSSLPGSLDPRDKSLRNVLALNPTVHPQPLNTTELAVSVPIPQLTRQRFEEWTTNHAKGNPYIPYAALGRLIKDKDLESHSECFLSHGDFFPRNILVEVRDDSTVELTGIIDWDSAEWAPAFVAMEAPCWLWRWNEYDSGELEDDKLRVNAALQPERREAQEIKHAFEAAVGEKFLKTAYADNVEVFRWVRFICKEGLGRSAMWQMAEEAVEALTDTSNLEHEAMDRTAE